MSRSVIVVAVALAGCGFQPAPATTDGQPRDTNSDATDGPADAPWGSEPLTVNPLCAAPDTTGLVLCLELDDLGLTAAKDGSGLGHDATVTMTNVSSRDVPTTSQAAQIISKSVIETADSTDFDLQTPTTMLWLHLENTPAMNGLYGLIHVRGQYYMAVDDQGNLMCTIESTASIISTTGPPITQGEWDLVACTYDGAQVCAYVFPQASGAPAVICESHNITLSTAFHEGASIGSIDNGDGTNIDHLAGKLDSARIFSRALTQQQICVGGGRSGC